MYATEKMDGKMIKKEFPNEKNGINQKPIALCTFAIDERKQNMRNQFAGSY